LAAAYLYRGAAYGGLGDEPHARRDIVTAVHLDPLLERSVTSEDEISSDMRLP
jgi:Flp pilus assembly protein TadD